MPLPLQYATVRIIYRPEEGKENQLVTYYYSDSTLQDVTQEQIDTFTSTLANSLGDGLKECIAADCRYAGINVAFHDNGVTFTSTSVEQSGVGDVLGDSQPPHVAVVIRKKTNVAGRTGYGRWFIGCVPEAWTDGARLNPTGNTGYTALKDALVGIQNFPNDNTMKPCHLSRKDNTLIPITSGMVDWVIRRQDRRRVRPTL